MSIMQTLKNPFDWFPGSLWWWPVDDEKLKQVNSWVVDVDHAIRHAKHQGVAVQAGGACGIWPSRLACFFERVYTFEPNEDNYNCLKMNCRHFENIVHMRAGLGAVAGSASLARDGFEDGNSGAWYLKDGSDFDVITIDSLNLDSCDLIMLDIEGEELNALLGAQETIKKFRPVVVVESKQLPHMKIPASAAGEYLEGLGYKLAGKYHNDMVYTC